MNALDSYFSERASRFKHLHWTVLPLVSMVVVALLLSQYGMPFTVRADPVITEYYVTTGNSATNHPDQIITGPDGALWFRNVGSYIYLDRVTTTGSFSANQQIQEDTSLTDGPDNAIWFTEQFANKIGRLDMDGNLTEYPLPQCSFGNSAVTCDPLGIVTGPDGALWFTEAVSNYGNYMGRITTDGTITSFPLPYTLAPHYLTVGPDGALWFTNTQTGNSSGDLSQTIGRITTDGTVTTFPVPDTAGENYAWDITAGPDGALWFTEDGLNRIGRITTDGTITQYVLPETNTVPVSITSGPDGALWFTENNVPNIGRITTNGTITEYPLPNPNFHTAGITAGPDGAVWFTEYDGNRIGRIAMPILSAPTNLVAASPAQQPSLSWDAVSGATSYNIYRDGANIGSSSTASYTDISAPEGTYTYYVTAVNSAGESGLSNSINVLVDRTPPTVSSLTLAQNPLATGTVTSVSATISDNLSGVTKAEYYIGIDPGQGNGTAMTISNGTATAPVGPFSAAGIYTIYVRGQDSAGNWSGPMPVNADVYNPSGGYTAGHGFIMPNGATSNPGDNLPTVDGPNVKATFDFTIKYSSSTSTTPTGTTTFTWGSGNCKKAANSCFVVTVDTSVNPNALSWLVVPGDNTATFQGIASVSLDGQTLGTNYVIRVSIVATTATTPGHYELQVYQAGSNSDTSTPLYQASGDLTGGAVLLH